MRAGCPDSGGSTMDAAGGISEVFRRRRVRPAPSCGILSFMEKTYEKVVDYVKAEILAGRLHPGDRLPSERELAEKLNSSRNSVREGLRVLDNIGVVSSLHGSGNYISLNFDETMTELLSFMYLLKGIREDQLTEFRRSIEWEAINLAVDRVSDQQKKELTDHLNKLESVRTESARVRHDRAIHQILVTASRNDFLITNYLALNNLMDQYISTMRARIISGMNDAHKLGEAHRMMVEGIVEGDAEKARKGLIRHFDYILEYGGSS